MVMTPSRYLFLCCLIVATHTFQVLSADHEETYVRTVPLPLLDQLFPSHTLDDSWEYQPLLSRASEKDDTCSKSNNTIPTVFIPFNDKTALSRQERVEFAESLISSRVLGEIVDRFHDLGSKYVYGTDYQLKKDGIDYFENVTDESKKKLDSWEQAQEIVNEGYSLIADGLQLIHSPIARVTRMLEHESGCNYATCNLYYTPPSNAGFEPHYDWMDVIVIQVKGMKTWSVKSEPCVLLSNEYQRIYPARKNVSYFEEFTMNAGDILYIPRGFTHNATSPPESTEASLHLTFGIEHQHYTTFEALMHHAVNLYANEANGFIVTPTEEGMEEEEGEEDCNDYVDWSDFLHFTLSELARIEGPEASYQLRESVPRHDAWKQLYAFRHKTTSFDEAFTNDYNDILDLVLELANETETRAFLRELVYFGVHLDGTYGYIGIDSEDVEDTVLCLLNATVDGKGFNATIKDFADFAQEHQAEVVESFEKRQAQKLRRARKNDDYWLVQVWRNTAECSDKYPLALRFGDETVDCKRK